ncbi:uncharacterized protein LOC131927859 [Physella acuta]|uniref:uncharacterized protein LOC131927859 n=1 Tax=Physella acuta TaxID=109671 RepID=UPI0027DCC363|nr:uncharacterized protein LOC131927859 [Physella acuta]
MSRFDISNFSPLPDVELICGICKNVLDKPMETSCRHVFCTECINQALDEQLKCPLCRKKCRRRNLKEVLPLVQNMINKLTMKCSNFDKGCTDLISLEKYLDHNKICEYAMVQCRYKGCSKLLHRKEVKGHEKLLCPYRDKKCELGCGLLVPMTERESHNCINALLLLVKVLQEKNSELEKKVLDLSKRNTAPISSQNQNLYSRPRSYDSDNIDRGIFDYLDSEYSYSEGSMSPFLGYYSDTDSFSSISRENFSFTSNNEVDVLPTNEHDYSHTDSTMSDNITFDNLPSSTAIGEHLFTDSPLRRETDSQGRRGNLPVFSKQKGNLANDNPSGSATRGSSNLDIPQLSSSLLPRHIYTEKNDYKKRVLEDDRGNEKESKRVKRKGKTATLTSGMMASTSTDVVPATSADMMPSTSTDVMPSTSADIIPSTSAKAMPSTSTMVDVVDYKQKTVSGIKKHPLGHKKIKKKSTPSKSVPSNSRQMDATFTPLAEDSNRDLTRDEENVEGTSSLSPIPHSSTTSARVRKGPLTRRSAKLLKKNIIKESKIPYVRVPPTAAYLLNKYGEEDSSDDSSWSPSEEV